MPEPQDVLEVGGHGLGERMVRALRHARAAMGRSPRTTWSRMATMGVIALAALMATVGAMAARGGDLRAGRNADLTDLVIVEVEQNRRLTGELAALRAEVEGLSKLDLADPALAAQLETISIQSGTTPVKGPAVKVVLTDAPLEVKPPGVSDDLLVVHQQDIQMVVNLLWASGAEAMTIQGQRVVSSTGVKCVGNTVVLHGVPYAPPYEIVAIGDVAVLNAALDSSPAVAIYKQYVEAYKLGWKQSTLTEVTMPAYQGSTTWKHARPPR
ncbi:DUF881 domain-containing protein [Aestuariimicrobium ganziense]|uniref:DUF881 domain-containing protein n=1 Tax=Aestuariimicrobium ganziense TaxID=2773677 RepID=UPI001F322D75|nr:DUF881 domain-containing protein [Aestuariimicrobium ganziense]